MWYDVCENVVVCVGGCGVCDVVLVMIGVMMCDDL